MPKKSVAEDMEKLKQRRDERKKKADEDKIKVNDIPDSNGPSKADTQFEKMIKKQKATVTIQPEQVISLLINKFTPGDNAKILVCVRKRPLSKKEFQLGEIDCISVVNPKLMVHECKVKIDGITKYIDDSDFIFDNTFSEINSSEDLFKYSVAPTLSMILNRGVVTVFAYGQTGSGKTYTMVFY